MCAHTHMCVCTHEHLDKINLGTLIATTIQTQSILEFHALEQWNTDKLFITMAGSIWALPAPLALIDLSTYICLLNNPVSLIQCFPQFRDDWEKLCRRQEMCQGYAKITKMAEPSKYYLIY